MGFLNPEEPRKCKKCDHRWYARRYGKPRLPRQAGAFYELGGWTGAAVNAQQRATAKYHKDLENWRKWAECPTCGSEKVKTPFNRTDFTPSAADHADSESDVPRLDDGDVAGSLSKLAQLHDAGALSDEEFEQAKSRVIHG